MAGNTKRGKQAMFDPSRFNAAAIEQLGTDAQEEQEVREVHEEQEVHEVQTKSGNIAHEVLEDYTPSIEFGATQGKKGHKAPRINMAFSPENHEWIKKRSRQLGISATEFVNAILTRERTNGQGN